MKINTLYDYICFKEWLNQNPKYSDIVKSKSIPEDSTIIKYLFTT